jgi:hypothetical protein
MNAFINDIVDNLFELGFNVIPVNSMKKPLVTWKEWQNKAISKEVFEKWKRDGLFKMAYAIITGILWRGPYKGKYLICIDIDNKKGIEEFLSNFNEIRSIDDLSILTWVVQHEDAKEEKAHIYFISDIPIVKRCGINRNRSNKPEDSQIPIIEVKADSSTYVVGPSSLHKNGHLYQIQGTERIKVLDQKGTEILQQTIEIIYEKYQPNSGSESNKSLLPNTSEMDNDDYIVHEGNNRHLNLLRKFDSWFAKSNKTLTFEELLARGNKWNKKHCDPPLGESEVLELIRQSMSFIDNNNNQTNIVFTTSNKANFLNDNKSDIQKETINQNELMGRISGTSFVDYVINIAKRTIKMEDNLVRLILYTALSTYTKNPINLGIMAPTSEGKTYAVSEVIKLVPKQDVWEIGSMSPKVIIRDRGVIVDENNDPLEEKITELKKILKKEKDTDIKQDIIDKIDSLYKKSKVVIDLSNKIFVFLEPPHPETWEILKTILSHDSYEIEHPYVFKTENNGQEVKHVVTRGWPACIFCSAKDDSSWSMWPEIQSRFFITSPNMVKKKYLESNKLIAQKKGMPSLVQEQLIVSMEEVENARDCVLLLKKTILKNRDNNVWVPFNSMLAEALPAEKGPDVRFVDRLFSMLNLITQINSFDRFKLHYGNEVLNVASVSDLDEVLRITQNITGIPAYKLDFFTNVFLPLFNTKKYPDSSTKDDLTEDKIALSTSELAQFYKEIKGKSVTTDNIKKTYLDELKNNGLIDDIQSKIDKRRAIYFPIVDTSDFQKNKNYTNISEDDNNLHFFRLKLSKDCNNIIKNWLNIEIIGLFKYGIGRTNRFKLFDNNNNELCICQFVKEYHKNGDLIRYFQTDENYIFNSKIFGKIIKIH